eukprot:12832749-Heterocapsa_arctica.AAC.1
MLILEVHPVTLEGRGRLEGLAPEVLAYRPHVIVEVPDDPLVIEELLPMDLGLRDLELVALQHHLAAHGTDDPRPGPFIFQRCPRIDVLEERESLRPVPRGPSLDGLGAQRRQHDGPDSHLDGLGTLRRQHIEGH